jgi:hypothetical protein
MWLIKIIFSVVSPRTTARNTIKLYLTPAV